MPLRNKNQFFLQYLLTCAGLCMDFISRMFCTAQNDPIGAFEKLTSIWFDSTINYQPGLLHDVPQLCAECLDCLNAPRICCMR